MLSCSGIGLGLVVLGMQVPMMALLLAVGVVWNHFRRMAPSGWSHGSAVLGGMGHAIRSGMLSNDGLILGTTALMSRPSWKDGLFALFSPRTPAKLACYLFLEAFSKTR